MIIQKSWMRNFRNYEKAEIVWNPEMNLITGRNAQGKTNLLESLVYLSLSKSFRTSTDTLLIKSGHEHAEIGCIVEEERQRRLDAVIHGKGKTLMVNRSPVKKSSDFVGILNVILFSPDDLGIFNDAPRERRRIMNQEIAKISVSYLHAMNRYQNLLRNRNALLKEYRPDTGYLDTLDEQMTAESAAIIRQRSKFIRGINGYISDLYKELSGDSIDVTVHYSCCIEDPDEEDIESQLRKMYESGRQRDLDQSVSSTGVHREDLIFEINGRNLIMTASQGQKRMAVLAFKMALLKYIRSETGHDPVLLLDDVLSELDLTRQEKLIDMVTGPYQCMITSAEVPEFLKRKKFNEYVVSAGEIGMTAGGME